MNYNDTLGYLYSQLPMFTRDGPSALTKDLTNTIELCKRLGNPQQKFKSIHIGGTNGKGSTSHMLAAVLQIAGNKTGLYTSPHLHDFRERIRINGRMIAEQQVIGFVEKHRPDFEDIRPSFFEMTVGMAFDAFAREKVDIAVIEVGLGGRLDSTNIITPLLCVITNIGWDHTNLLGDTLELIAGEKAGIIKPRIPVIVGERQPEVSDVFMSKARLENAPICFASDEWILKDNRQKAQRGGHQTEDVVEYLDYTVSKTSALSSHHLQLDLTGSYQLKNVKAVLTAVEELNKQGFTITQKHVKTALRQVKKLTGLHGRWEILSRHPLTICDTGHNPEGIAEVLKNIGAIAYRQLHFVMGMVNDKDIAKILALLPKNATYYFCKPDIPRGLDAKTLAFNAERFDLHGQAYASVRAAYDSAKESAGENDMVFVGGSTFVVAEIV